MIKLILSMVVPIFVVGALSSYASPANQPIVFVVLITLWFLHRRKRRDEWAYERMKQREREKKSH